MTIELNEEDLTDLSALLETIAKRHNIALPEDSNMFLDAIHSDIVENIEHYIKALSEVKP